MKKTILTIIISGILFSSLGAYAALVISSSEVAVSSVHTDKTNVKDSLDELYDIIDNELTSFDNIANMKQVDNIFTDYPNGNDLPTTINLAKGKYMILWIGYQPGNGQNFLDSNTVTVGQCELVNSKITEYPVRSMTDNNIRLEMYFVNCDSASSFTITPHLNSTAKTYADHRGRYNTIVYSL